jgi:hypothetical protein
MFEKLNFQKVNDRKKLKVNFFILNGPKKVKS